jgi:hypothetical protein
MMSDLVPFQAQQPKTVRESENIQFQPGSWWRLKEQMLPQYGPTYDSGTYFMCSEVKYAHGQPHTMVMQQPPGSLIQEDQRYPARLAHYSWVIEEFLGVFEPASPAEAMASRDQEIAELNNQIGNIQKDIITTQSDLIQISTATSNPVGLLAAPDTQSITPEARNSLVISAQDDLNKKQVAIKAAAESLQLATKDMQAKSSKLSIYYQERADAALAAVKPVIDVVNRLSEQIDTMGLYVGTDIQADLLVDGESAPTNENLHLFQRKLFMDEEMLINLLDGGADYSDIDNFKDMLSTNKSLVDRIFGARRSVVVMAYRRNPKERPAGKSIADFFQLIAKEDADKEVFLLIRDGGKIWQVFLPNFLTSLERMFPTPDDLDAPYREKRWFSQDPVKVIGQDSTKYAEAVEEFRKLALQYERLLLVMWGLHDRLEIFGPFVKGSDYKSFADPRLQQERFTMIMDDQHMIGPNRPSYRDWIVEKNKSLKHGSRIVGIWKNIMSPETAPMACTYARGHSHRVDFKYIPDEKFGMTTVRREGSKLYIEVPVHREVYDKDSYEYRMRHINAKVFLESSYIDQYNFGILVLDDVDFEDLDFYINSRSQREHYLQYAGVLVAARDVLKKDLLEEEPARLWLENAAKSARFYEKHEAGEVNRAIRETLRGWRVEKGGPPPAIETQKWSAASEILLKKIWHVLGHDNDEDLVFNVEKLIGSEFFEEPIRLVRDGLGRLICYSKPNLESLERELVMIKEWPYINKHVLSVTKSGSVKKQSTTEVLPFSDEAGETLVHAFTKEAIELPYRFGISSGLLRSALDTAESLFSKPNLLLGDFNLDESEIKKLSLRILNEYNIRSHNDRSKYGMLIPFGIGVIHQKDHLYSSEKPEKKMYLWCLSETSLSVLSRHSQAGFEQADKIAKKLYPRGRAMPSVNQTPYFALAAMPLKKAALVKMAEELDQYGYALSSSSAVEMQWNYSRLPTWSPIFDKFPKKENSSEENLKGFFNYLSPEAMGRIDAAFQPLQKPNFAMRS